MNEELTLLNNQEDVEQEIDIFYMPNYKERKGYCPVRDMHISEYQIPLELMSRLPKSGQSRVQDCSESSVIEKAEQMKSPKGQTTGICVLANKSAGTFDVFWGNTRLRGGKILDSRGEKIYNCDKGHIWASLYEHDISDLDIFQAIENNIHDVNERATLPDNINSILRMIDRGKADIFIPDNTDKKSYNDVDQEKQRVAVKKLYEKCSMPSNKFQTLWNQVKKQNKATSRKMRTWDKNEQAVYFGAHNDYGITKEQCNATTESGTVFEVEIDGKTEKLAIYFVSKQSEFATSGVANPQYKRNVRKEATYVVTVVSLNDSKGASINKSRETVINKIREWNSEIKAGKSIDRILFIPQTEQEQDVEMIAGEYLKDTLF
tara:strand:- start:8906 stop:10033 length:1128 start_codon:yes stop_codon:yes gene_type:complete